MRTRHLVDPELFGWLDQFPTFTLSADSLPVIRQNTNEMIGVRPSAEGTGATMEERTIAGGSGQPMTVLVYRPSGMARPAPAILQIHGGGYVTGSAAMGDTANRLLAESLQAVVVAVDYRLSPETTHPGPVEDCYAALKWLATEAAELGVAPELIALKGESAGGGLAAGLALLARDRGGPAIRHLHLLAPMLDDRTGVDGDQNPYTGEFVFTRESNRFCWRALLGREPGGEGVSPYAAAARADDLAGLPPTYLSVGSLDLFVDESMGFAQRLLRAGVPAELHVWPGAYHGFKANFHARLTLAAEESSLDALRRNLRR